MSAQAVCKWEQGITSPDISLLPEIAKCFGVTIDSLFHGVPERKYPGYGNERNELSAMYTSERGTEEDFRRAADAYEEVILSGNATTTDYMSYGILHRDRAFRDIKIAFHYYRRAISEGDKCRDLQWMCAHQCIINLLADLVRIDEAVEEQRKWCEREPDCAGAHVYYASALEKTGDLEKAWEEVEKALRLEPEDANVHICAGDLCAKLGQFDEAVIHWDKAYELEPNDIACLFSKAEMYASVGKKDKAISQFEDILIWLEEHGFNMEIEGVHPRRRIEELRG